MLYPSKADCIAILSAASRVSDADMLLALDHKNLGLSRNAMDAARHASDALELVIADERWPLPKYREMLFPV